MKKILQDITAKCSNSEQKINQNRAKELLDEEAVLQALRKTSNIIQEDDPFEKQLRIDVESGKFDQLIAEVIAEDDLGETIDIETSCH